MAKTPNGYPDYDPLSIKRELADLAAKNVGQKLYLAFLEARVGKFNDACVSVCAAGQMAGEALRRRASVSFLAIGNALNK
ncbi:MAG: hypothetical protein PHX61_09755 [Alphaproteobacteria bacterium]|nr:hypothetical protein [Alphaproteobacteria bacterium]